MAVEGDDTGRGEDDLSPEAVQAAKKRARINALILAAVLLLGAVLPPQHKAYAPFLFLIPLIITILNRINRARARSADVGAGRDYSSLQPKDAVLPEPYSSTPKDPKDPRRYKPIG